MSDKIKPTEEIVLDITTVSVTKEYRISDDYNSVSGTVGATATVRPGATRHPYLTAKSTETRPMPLP